MCRIQGYKNIQTLEMACLQKGVIKSRAPEDNTIAMPQADVAFHTNFDLFRHARVIRNFTGS